MFPRKGLDLHLVGCSRHGLILEQLGSVMHSVREGLPLPLRSHGIGAWTLAEQGDTFLQRLLSMGKVLMAEVAA